MASEKAMAWAGMSPTDRANAPAMWASMSTEERAESIGLTHGRNAGNGLFDGNTSRATYEGIIRALDDGDPALYDSFNLPNLSGEYSDEFTEKTLAEDTGYAPAANDLEDAEGRSVLADRYNDAASEGFWHEVERVARYQTEPEADRQAE